MPSPSRCIDTDIGFDTAAKTFRRVLETGMATCKDIESVRTCRGPGVDSVTLAARWSRLGLRIALGFACGADSYTSRDRQIYTETTIATAGDVHDTATESVCICRHTGPNLSSPPLVLVAVVLLSSPMAEGGSLFSLRGHL